MRRRWRLRIDRRSGIGWHADPDYVYVCALIGVLRIERERAVRLREYWATAHTWTPPEDLVPAAVDEANERAQALYDAWFPGDTGHWS